MDKTSVSENNSNYLKVILAYSGFYSIEPSEIVSELYDSKEEALSSLYWEFHKNPSLQAFIINKSGEVINDIDNLSNTIGLASREAYGVQAISEENKLITCKEIYSGSCFPTLDEAREAAKNIIRNGYKVKLGLPDGTILNTEDI